MAKLETMIHIADIEEVKAIIDQLKAENAKLKAQMEKAIEALGNENGCPDEVGLVTRDIRCADTKCETCWREALSKIEAGDA